MTNGQPATARSVERGGLFIDAHTHTQPSVAAGRAFLEALDMGDVPNEGDVTELLARQDAAGIAHSLIVPWLPAQDLVDAAVAHGQDRDEATAAVIARWRDLNAWATASVRQHPDRLSCLVGLDPVLMGEQLIRDEVALRLSEGAAGLKIAPMFLRVPPNDPQVEIVWKLARDHEVFVLSESGEHLETGLGDWGHPRYFHDVLSSYPSVVVQLAHFGVHAEEEVLRLAEAYDNVRPDLAMRLDGWWAMPPDEGAELIRKVGAEKVLFATNYPIVDPVNYAAILRDWPLTDDEVHQVGYANAARLFGLSAIR
jgi:predicted TIM-barrel fold metal-dependent hydrolase